MNRGYAVVEKTSQGRQSDLMLVVCNYPFLADAPQYHECVPRSSQLTGLRTSLSISKAIGAAFI